MQLWVKFKNLLVGIKDFVGENVRLYFWLSLAFISMTFLGTEITFIYILTVGAWLVDVTIKEFRIDDNPTMYADLSFVCFVSYVSQIVASLGIEDVTRDAFMPLLVITFALFALWLKNIMASTNRVQSRVDRATSFLCTVTSVVFLLLGPQIIAILKGL